MEPSSRTTLFTCEEHNYVRRGHGGAAYFFLLLRGARGGGWAGCSRQWLEGEEPLIFGSGGFAHRVDLMKERGSEQGNVFRDLCVD